MLKTTRKWTQKLKQPFHHLRFYLSSVILLTGSKILRPGRDYNFAVSAGALKGRLLAQFTLSGNSDAGDRVELKLVNQTIRANFMRSFKFMVLADFLN